MPLTIFNLSMVDHLYIGKDTMITFAEQPVLETYNIELTNEDKIKEHLAKPQNWVPQRHKTLPEIPYDTAFICSLADYQDPIRCNCRIKTSQQILGRNSRSSAKNMEKLSPRTMRTLAEPNLLKWTLIQGVALR